MSKSGNEHAFRVSAVSWLAHEMRCNRLWFVKIAGSPYQRAGVPDVIGCCQGRFFAVELKVDGTQPEPRQEREMAAIVRCGKGRVGVARNMEELKNLVYTNPL